MLVFKLSLLKERKLENQHFEEKLIISENIFRYISGVGGIPLSVDAPQRENCVKFRVVFSTVSQYFSPSTVTENGGMKQVKIVNVKNLF